MQTAVAEYNKERRKTVCPIGIGVGLHLADLMLGIIGVKIGCRARWSPMR